MGQTFFFLLREVLVVLMGGGGTRLASSQRAGTLFATERSIQETTLPIFSPWSCTAFQRSSWACMSANPTMTSAPWEVVTCNRFGTLRSTSLISTVPANEDFSKAVRNWSAAETCDDSMGRPV